MVAIPASVPRASIWDWTTSTNSGGVSWRNLRVVVVVSVMNFESTSARKIPHPARNQKTEQHQREADGRCIVGNLSSLTDAPCLVRSIPNKLKNFPLAIILKIRFVVYGWISICLDQSFLPKYLAKMCFTPSLCREKTVQGSIFVKSINPGKIQPPLMTWLIKTENGF